MSKANLKKVVAKSDAKVVTNEVETAEKKPLFQRAAAVAETKNKSDINFAALVLAAMFLSEGSAEQVKSEHKEACIAFLSTGSSEIVSAKNELLESGLIDEASKLTSLGRSTAIKRSNWSVNNQYSLSFADFLCNTKFGYQVAALGILLLGDSKKSATGIVDKVVEMIGDGKFTPSEDFKGNILAMVKKMIDLADAIGILDDVDDYIAGFYPANTLTEAEAEVAA